MGALGVAFGQRSGMADGDAPRLEGLGLHEATHDTRIPDERRHECNANRANDPAAPKVIVSGSLWAG
jgi:hypothetical protein